MRYGDDERGRISFVDATVHTLRPSLTVAELIFTVAREALRGRGLVRFSGVFCWLRVDPVARNGVRGGVFLDLDLRQGVSPGSMIETDGIDMN